MPVQQAHLAGEALARGDGHRVAEGEGAGADGLWVEPGRHRVVRLLVAPGDLDAVVFVDRRDHGAVAVEDVGALAAAAAVIVLAHAHQVAHREVDVRAAGQGVAVFRAEFAALPTDLLCAQVQQVHVRVLGGQYGQRVDQVVRVGPAAAYLIPGGEDLPVRLDGALGGVDAAGVGQDAQGLLVVAGAPHLQGGALGVVALAPVLDEREAADESVDLLEPAARADRLELLGVADRHQFGAGALRLLHQGGGLPVVGHGGLVDDQDVDAGESVTVADLRQPGGDRAGRDAGGVVQALGRDRAHGGAGVGVAGGVPRDPARLHERALAGAGRADVRVDAVPGGQRPLDRRALFAGQGEAVGDLEDGHGGRGLLGGQLHRALVEPDQGLAGDELLGVEDVAGGVAVHRRHDGGTDVREAHRVSLDGEDLVREFVQQARLGADAELHRRRHGGEQLRAGERLLRRRQPGLGVEDDPREVVRAGPLRTAAGTVDARTAAVGRPGRGGRHHRVDVADDRLGAGAPAGAHPGRVGVDFRAAGLVGDALPVLSRGIRAHALVERDVPAGERVAQLLGDMADLPRAGLRVVLAADTERRVRQLPHPGLEVRVEGLGVSVEVLSAVGDGSPLAVLAQRHVGDRDVDVQVRVSRFARCHRTGGEVLHRPAEQTAGRDAHLLSVLAGDGVADPLLGLADRVVLRLLHQLPELTLAEVAMSGRVTARAGRGRGGGRSTRASPGRARRVGRPRRA
ncbi:hypothetical protein SAMN04490357_7716 [Streptomyces misionensis]|uniref:Uncharacterized protein n=1 Tax=Streptomyces misionensis TaxID=67331 RepID=A0A1H5K760_9ACTN|nr:hypothetical protein SAMN04490357_7716 [Streptomyces misionensis]